MATPTWMAALSHDLAFAPDGVELGHLAESQRHGLDQQDTVEQAVGDRPLEILLGEPRHRAVDVDGGGEVVVRDLALGARHGGADGLPEPGLAVHRRPRRWRRLRPRGRRPLDVLAPDRPAGAGAADSERVDAELVASFRASGEIRARPGAAGAAGGWRRGRRGARAEIRGAAGGPTAGTPARATDAGASASSRMMASTVPVGTVAPGWTRIFSSTPVVKISMSITPLSVSTTAMMSPRLTASPGLLAPRDQRPGAHVRAEDRHEELSHEPPAVR